MHLAIVTCELAADAQMSGGLGRFSANLARIFAKNGHKVTIIYSSVREEKLSFDEGISLHTAYVEKPLWNFLDSMAETVSGLIGEERNEVRKCFVNIYKSEQIKKIVEEVDREDKIDLIHVCDLGSLALRLGNNIPYVVRISSFTNLWEGAESPKGIIEYKENIQTIKHKLRISILQRARYVVCPSNLLAQVARENLGIDPTVIESPFLLDREHWDYRIYDSELKGKKYIFHFGRLCYLKGTHIVAGIAKRILEKYPDISIVLAGDSLEILDEDQSPIMAYELVRKQAGEYADRIIYMGYLDRKQLYPIIQKAELCLLPSRIDNLPNACIESMALGKIVVGTEGASFEQLIDDRISGFLCERDNLEAFLQAVEESLNMTEETKANMSMRASDRIQQLSPDVIYKEYNRYYQKVIREWKECCEERIEGKVC